jgi:S-adenosylmethionine:tRNA ribosyltransferase-isomerase
LAQGQLTAIVLGREGEFFVLQFELLSAFDHLLSALDHCGQLPLPPYIEREKASQSDEDDARYQTVFAKHEGAVAAPTAGLHFTEAMLHAIAAKGVHLAYITLHVGAGTFQPIRNDSIAEHTMHTERFEISASTADRIASVKKAGKRVIAVGTTAVRALESAAMGHGHLRLGAQETAIFITPGYSFQIVDGLLTNFHLPRSTLLMLVAALIGVPTLHQAYAHAIAQSYRFFSYGDAMYISPEAVLPDQN